MSYLFGSGGNDHITGGNTTNFIDGGTGHNVLEGNGGNNVLVYHEGDTRVDGGSGINILRLDSSSDLNLSLEGLDVVSSTGVRLSHLSVIDMTGSGQLSSDGVLYHQGSNDLSISEDVVEALSNLTWGDVEIHDAQLAQAFVGLLDSSDQTPVLFVNGDSNDSVNLLDTNTWSSVGVADGYNAYIPSDHASLVLIQTSINNIHAA